MALCLKVAETAGADLASIVRTIHEDYSTKIEKLAELGATARGAANLWMAGIADDALRDTHTIRPGRLLDPAIIGAVRKALAADEGALENQPAVERLKDMRRRNRESDARLVELLEGLHAEEKD